MLQYGSRRGKPHGAATMKIYLDNDVISAMGKDDMPARVASPISLIEAMFEAGVLSGGTSQVSMEELNKWHGDKKPLVMTIYQHLPQVPYIERQKFLGMNTYWDLLTSICSPMIEDNRTWVKLQTFGLKALDAHHLMVAISNDCDVFLTNNWRDFDSRRSQIKQAFPKIRIMWPWEVLYQL
jgi:hypothetical protein